MNIAIIGMGVVGGGVWELLKDGSLGLHVKRILDIRPIEGLEGILTDNIGDIITDPQIDCVVEAIGGLHPALSFVASALRSGKHVVTSNKELVSHAIAPLLEGAAAHGAQIRFSASVGGGVPWLHNLLRAKRADRLLNIYGIVNGTTNYILDAMHHGLDFDEALADARRLGYAEADATADLEGLDAKRKCAISASLAFDTIVENEDIPVLGISSVTREDIKAFSGHGFTVKLLMFSARVDGGVCAYVEPTLLGPDALAAHTPTNHNCISLCGEKAGHLAFFGQGAGRFPTAENIVQDLLDITSRLSYGVSLLEPLPVRNEMELHPYYVRTSCAEMLRDAAAEYWADNAAVTRPMHVMEAHALAAKIKAQDPDAFIAGIPGL